MMPFIRSGERDLLFFFTIAGAKLARRTSAKCDVATARGHCTSAIPDEDGEYDSDNYTLKRSIHAVIAAGVGR